MSNFGAEGVCWPSALDRAVAETGRLLPGVHRCLQRVETPRRPKGWTGVAAVLPGCRLVAAAILVVLLAVGVDFHH